MLHRALKLHADSRPHSDVFHRGAELWVEKSSASCNGGLCNLAGRLSPVLHSVLPSKYWHSKVGMVRNAGNSRSPIALGNATFTPMSNDRSGSEPDARLAVSTKAKISLIRAETRSATSSPEEISCSANNLSNAERAKSPGRAEGDRK